MLFPTYHRSVANRIEQYHDLIRHSTIALAIQRLETDQIFGAFAEVGVYRGATSVFIHHQVPQYTFDLFDTFEGFQAPISRPRKTIASKTPPERPFAASSPETGTSGLGRGISRRQAQTLMRKSLRSSCWT
jgi:hypothetical protein